MVKELVFEKTADGESVARFVSAGPVTVQVQRRGMADVVVCGNLAGMPPCITDIHRNPYNDGIILGIDLPMGVEVTVKVGCDVVSAKMMGND